MTDKASEILINATRVNASQATDLYEFVLNDSLYIIECVRVESLAEGIIYPVNNYLHTLQNGWANLTSAGYGDKRIYLAFRQRSDVGQRSDLEGELGCFRPVETTKLTLRNPATTGRPISIERQCQAPSRLAAFIARRLKKQP